MQKIKGTVTHITYKQLCIIIVPRFFILIFTRLSNPKLFVNYPHLSPSLPKNLYNLLLDKGTILI
jgi:hypothetical protein